MRDSSRNGPANGFRGARRIDKYSVDAQPERKMIKRSRLAPRTCINIATAGVARRVEAVVGFIARVAAGERHDPQDPWMVDEIGVQIVFFWQREFEHDGLPSGQVVEVFANRGFEQLFRF